MKKIYAFLAASMMSLSLFAAPENVPTTQDLAAKYDVGNAVVLCCYFDVAPCNPVVVTGEYGSISWSGNIDELESFEPLSGFDGWYVVEVPFTAGKTVSLRPVQLTGDKDAGYTFDWDYGAGGMADEKAGLPDAWTFLGGKTTATVSGSGFGDEGTLACTEAGAYIYEISRWKGGKSPCVELIKHNYTLVLFPPYCEKNDEYFVPAVAGKPFNNWEGFEALAMIEYQGKDAYGIVVNAAEGWEFKFSDKTFGFDNEYVWLKEEDQSWQTFDNFQFPVATKDTTLVYDWSDNTKYAYKMCDADVYEVELTAKLPAGAPEAGVELMGTFVGGSWQEGIEMDYDAIEEAYTASFKAIEKSEFKFRELGTWNNEIMYFEDEQWVTAPNFKVGEEWEFDQETLTATIELDLSDPTEYKWKISSSEGIENVVLTEKAHKVVVDGAIYIVRDNKLFNIHGAQVR
jgi:hypothetical protein